MNAENLTIKKGKATTFEEVQKRLKNKSLEDYTDEDILDRYIAYRNRRRIKYSWNTKVTNTTWLYKRITWNAWFYNR